MGAAGGTIAAVSTQHREHLRPLSQVEIECEIERLSTELEAATETYARLCREDAEAENAYQRRYHRAVIVHSERTTRADGSKATVAWVDAQAKLACETEAEVHRIKAAELRAVKEALNTKRTQMDSLRTLAANVRGQS
jgi:hypothetical protein